MYYNSYSNGKYEAIKFGVEQLVKRLQKEGRLIVEVRIDKLIGWIYSETLG